MRQSPDIIKEGPKQLDPELKYGIDMAYRDDPELRKDILQSLDAPATGEYVVDADLQKVKFTENPEIVLKDYIETHNLGNIIDIIGGGNGVAALLDKDKVIKLTGDEGEHLQAQSLVGKENEYIVNVFASEVFDTPYYTKDSNPAYLLVLELLTHPTKEEEEIFNICCCKEDKPILVDFDSDPTGKVIIHPPVDGSDKCRRVYEDLINIHKEIEATGRRWLDIGITNLGMKNGHYALLDLGTNEPLPPTLKEENISDKPQLGKINPLLEVGDKIVVIDRKGFHGHYMSDEELIDRLESEGHDMYEEGFEDVATNNGYSWDAGQQGWYKMGDDIDWEDTPELYTPYIVIETGNTGNGEPYYTLLTPEEVEYLNKEVKVSPLSRESLTILDTDPKSLYPGIYTWLYSKDTTLKKYLNEQYEFKNEGGEITPKIITLLTTAYRLDPSTYFEKFYDTIKKYLDINGIFSGGDGKQLAAILWLIVQEHGGFNKPNFFLLGNPLPEIHYYNVEYYSEDYDIDETIEECYRNGAEYYGVVSHKECKCIEWEDIYDDEKNEYRECTETEKDNEECDCNQLDEKHLENYYYDLLQGEFISTIKLDPYFENITNLSINDKITVDIESNYYETSAYEIEADFDFALGGDVQDWSEMDLDVEYYLQRLNDILYPTTKIIKEEQQLDLFHGGWPFDSTMEDEEKEWIIKEYPENAVKYLYKKWDKDGINWDDLKLLGMRPYQGDGQTMLLKRYIMNTQVPIPVTSVWDCESLANLFYSNVNTDITRKYLCAEDEYDWEMWYDSQFDTYILSSLDDESWAMIVDILGVKDIEIAERLFDDNTQNEEEEELINDKDYEISEIKRMISQAQDIEMENATKRAIYENILEQIIDWFDGSGKLIRDNNDGSYSWVIESDLRNWISDEDWDNTDFFQFNDDLYERPLEEVMRDMARLTPQNLFEEIMMEEFGPGDKYNDGKRGESLEIPDKFLNNYWYPDINEQYFNDMVHDDLYELVSESKEPPTPPDPSSLKENIDSKELNLPLEVGDEIMVVHIEKVGMNVGGQGEAGDWRGPNQLPELFVPYRVTSVHKQSYGINKPLKDVSDLDRPGAVFDRANLTHSKDTVMRYLIPRLDSWVILTKNKGMWDAPEDLLNEERVTNFKELYNASPRPLQQILMDQWKAKQNPEWHPEGNVLKHIITVTNRAFAEQPDNINLILAAYFHDLGKLATAEVNPKTGQPTAHGHEKVSTELVNEYTEFIESLGGIPETVSYIVSNHMKMKPRTWDVMRQSKKDNITDHPSFEELDAFSKIDRGGLHLEEESKGKKEFGKDEGMYDDDQYYEFTPFTNLEVKLLNKLAQEFSKNDLEEIGKEDTTELSPDLSSNYSDIMKLFGIVTLSLKNWVKSTKYARWTAQNLDDATDEEGNIDFANVKQPAKIYPSLFEVGVEESGWEKVYKHGDTEIAGFGTEDVSARAVSNFYEWGGETETYDWGDYEADGWEIDSAKHLETLKEHTDNPTLRKYLEKNYTEEVFGIYKRLATAHKLLNQKDKVEPRWGCKEDEGTGGGWNSRRERWTILDTIETSKTELHELWVNINEDLYKLGLLDTLDIGPPDETDFISYNYLRGLTPNPVVQLWARQIIYNIEKMELVELTGKSGKGGENRGREKAKIWVGNIPYILREHTEDKVNPQLMVGDEIIVVDVDKEPLNWGCDRGMVPTLFIPYVVVAINFRQPEEWMEADTDLKYYILLPVETRDQGEMYPRTTLWSQDKWIYNSKFRREELNEERQPKLNPQLMVGDEIIVVDMKKEKKGRVWWGKDDGGDGMLPTLYQPYVVTAILHRQPENWESRDVDTLYYELEAITHSRFKLGIPTVLYPEDKWIYNTKFRREELNEERQPELNPELEVGDTIRVIDLYSGEGLAPKRFGLYQVKHKGYLQRRGSHKADYDKAWYQLVEIDEEGEEIGKEVWKTEYKLLHYNDTWIYADIPTATNVDRKTISEHKVKLNPPLNTGDVIRVVDVDKETKYKQSAGAGMYRNVTRGELHGLDTYPTPMETYVVMSILSKGDENIHWYLYPISRGNNSDDPNGFEYTSADTSQGPRIMTNKDKWIMIEKLTQNLKEQKEKESGLEDDDLYVEYGPFTPLEVKILNTIVKEFKLEELASIASRAFKHNIDHSITAKYDDIMKLFGEPISSNPGQWVVLTKYARWAIDNINEADDGDYGQIKNARKEYPSQYEVEAEESGWEKIHKTGTAEVTAFGTEDAEEKATEDFYEWGGEMETYEYGDYDSEHWEITDTSHIKTLKEQQEKHYNAIRNFLEKNYKEDVFEAYKQFSLHKRLEPPTNPTTRLMYIPTIAVVDAMAELAKLWTTINEDLYKLGLIRAYQSGRTSILRAGHGVEDQLMGLISHPMVREWVYEIMDTVDEMEMVSIRDEDENFVRYDLQEDTIPLKILKEQKIDISKIPKEEISPPLKVGDKVFAWDLVGDPAPPGGHGGDDRWGWIPTTTVGTVTEVYTEDEVIERWGYRGGIKYTIDTYDGVFGLYQGVEDYEYFSDDGGGRDKWVIIKNTPLVEAVIPLISSEERPNIPNYIRRLLIVARFEYKGGWGKNPQNFLLYMTPMGKIVDIVKSGNISNMSFKIGDTVNIFDLRDFEDNSDYTLIMGGKLRGDIAEHIDRHSQAIQKDFMIKRKFFESFSKIDLATFMKIYSEDISTAQLLEKRKLMFNFLTEVKNKELTHENFFSHFLVGGKEWIKTYATVLKKDSGTLSEQGDEIKNLIWETTIHFLKNKNEKVTLRETQQHLLPTAANLVNLWKETL